MGGGCRSARDRAPGRGRSNSGRRESERSPSVCWSATIEPNDLRLLAQGRNRGVSRSRLSAERAGFNPQAERASASYDAAGCESSPTRCRKLGRLTPRLARDLVAPPRSNQLPGISRGAGQAAPDLTVVDISFGYVTAAPRLAARCLRLRLLLIMRHYQKHAGQGELRTTGRRPRQVTPFSGRNRRSWRFPFRLVLARAFPASGRTRPRPAAAHLLSLLKLSRLPPAKTGGKAKSAADRPAPRAPSARRLSLAYLLPRAPSARLLSLACRFRPRAPSARLSFPWGGPTQKLTIDSATAPRPKRPPRPVAAGRPRRRRPTKPPRFCVPPSSPQQGGGRRPPRSRVGGASAAVLRPKGRDGRGGRAAAAPWRPS